jgi:hypothetical protein
MVRRAEGWYGCMALETSSLGCTSGAWRQIRTVSRIGAQSNTSSIIIMTTTDRSSTCPTQGDATVHDLRYLPQTSTVPGRPDSPVLYLLHDQQTLTYRISAGGEFPRQHAILLPYLARHSPRSSSWSSPSWKGRARVAASSYCTYRLIARPPSAVLTLCSANEAQLSRTGSQALGDCPSLSRSQRHPPLPTGSLAMGLRCSQHRRLSGDRPALPSMRPIRI